MPDTPSSPPSPAAPPPAATITDRRTVPAGVLPRRVQTWLMAGLAIGMLAIMLIIGRPEPPTRPATTAATVVPPSADRVRDFQDRLRMLETQAQQDTQAVTVPDPPMPYSDMPAAAPQDAIEADRRRREYESLFASNVVLSRRPDREQPDAGRQTVTTAGPLPTTAGTVPSVDEVADAVVRATTRTAGLTTPALPTPPAAAAGQPSTTSERARTPDRTEAIRAAGPLHRVLEGTLIDAVLTNRLDATNAAPVNCLVTNPLYSHSGQHVLIPAGARVLGETTPVRIVGETRLAVAFHRLLLPDGRTYRLDQFMGLNQIGDAGLRDQVNSHYLATFGAAAAVGLVSGLSQFLGSVGFGRGDGNRTVIIAGGVGDTTSQAAMQVMNRFLNRLPTITIREGHRVRIYLTSDLELPAYTEPVTGRPF